ncbi:MAG: tRNA-guanine transglycosylase, partial [Thermoguttaceae bacterium]
MPFFQLIKTCDRTSARRGVISFRRGTVQTPTFMPVGTLGTVKGIEIEMLRASGAEIILGNTYHLALRPGEETVAALGGLH